MPGSAGGPILDVRHLSTSFFTDDGEVKAVRDVSFSVAPGETVGIVGESGCGKSVTALSILGLVQRPGRVVGGEISFQGLDLLHLDPDELRQIRGRDIAMIFQDPLSSLNPVLSIGYQVNEAMWAHNVVAKEEVRPRSIDLLQRVRVPDAARRIRDYPHQFSGGMRQRAMIAMGLSNRPSLIIADEPTTALDVTVQAQILELLRDLNRETGTSIILITHNLGVVAGLCARVIVMYAGQIVEEGSVEQIFESPQHPYTWSLLRSLPRIDADRRTRLTSIEGLPPDLIAPPPGCAFHPRCPFRLEQCFVEAPVLAAVGRGQSARCWVTMRRADAEMGAGSITDTRPGAASGVRPPADAAPRSPLAGVETPAKISGGEVRASPLEPVGGAAGPGSPLDETPPGGTEVREP
jgi:oligopeptide/dipeptide ABC transporter ATP-binding protein